MEVVSRAVAGRHEGEGKTRLRQGFTLEGIHVGDLRPCGEQAPGHVDGHGGEVLTECIGLTEVRRSLELVDQFLRHGLARLVVACVVAQDDGVGHPMLVELRRHLDEVSWGVCSREGLVLLRSEDAVECVPKLMEHRLDVVRRQEGWSSLGRGGEVADVVDDRLRTEEGALLDEVGHPGATGLGGATEVVGVEEGQRSIVLVEDLIDLDAISIDGDVRARLEGQTIEAVSGEEDPIL